MKMLQESITYPFNPIIDGRKNTAAFTPSQAKRLKELEKENDRLKKLLAEVMLDNQILKDINSGNL